MSKKMDITYSKIVVRNVVACYLSSIVIIKRLREEILTEVFIKDNCN